MNWRFFVLIELRHFFKFWRDIHQSMVIFIIHWFRKDPFLNSQICQECHDNSTESVGFFVVEMKSICLGIKRMWCSYSTKTWRKIWSLSSEKCPQLLWEKPRHRSLMYANIIKPSDDSYDTDTQVDITCYLTGACITLL